MGVHSLNRETPQVMVFTSFSSLQIEEGAWMLEAERVSTPFHCGSEPLGEML